MQKLQNKKGFTLIELLVVITIIGILATGATATYTSQIQKARDTTRINDVKALQSGIEQVFQDLAIYPGNSVSTIAASVCDTTSTPANTSVYCAVKMGFTNKLPKDPKSGQAGIGTALEYSYNVGAKDGVANQIYELSNGFESTGNKTAKAANTVDSGNDDNRAEFGMPVDGLETCINGTTACTGNSTNSTVTAASCTVLNATTGNVVIRGNCL